MGPPVRDTFLRVRFRLQRRQERVPIGRFRESFLGVLHVEFATEPRNSTHVLACFRWLCF